MADPMALGSNDLIEAAIQHLEGLRSRGARFVALTPEALNILRGGPTATPILRPMGSASLMPPASAQAPSVAQAREFRQPAPTPTAYPAAPLASRGPAQTVGSPQAAKATALAALR